jgi:hypothetical protein
MEHPVPPYGTAIHDAIASGDVNRMRQVASQAEEYLRHAEEVRAALGTLHDHIRRAGTHG